MTKRITPRALIWLIAVLDSLAFLGGIALSFWNRVGFGASVGRIAVRGGRDHLLRHARSHGEHEGLDCEQLCGHVFRAPYHGAVREGCGGGGLVGLPAAEQLHDSDGSRRRLVLCCDSGRTHQRQPHTKLARNEAGRRPVIEDQHPWHRTSARRGQPSSPLAHESDLRSDKHQQRALDRDADPSAYWHVGDISRMRLVLAGCRMVAAAQPNR